MISGIQTIEAVQQSKTGQKRRGDNALNQKGSKIFGAKNNCETVSIGFKLKKTTGYLRIRKIVRGL